MAEYEESHKAVWPEMLQALRETGWSNYSLFMRPDGLLIGYLETENFERAKSEMAKREVNARWQRAMSELFDIPAGVNPDSTMAPIKEVFHLD